MSKTKKIVLIVSAVCILIGLALAASGWYSLLNVDPTDLSTQFSETAHAVESAFDSIRIYTLDSDIQLLPSEDGQCRVYCCDYEKRYHEVSVENGALVIRQVDELKWYESIGIFWNSTPYVTVYLPETTYKAAELESIGGDVTVAPGFTFDTVHVQSTSGNVKLSDLSAGQLSVYSSSGDILLRSSRIAGDIYLENISGCVELEDVTAAALSIGTTSGDIRLYCPSADSLTLSSSSGIVTIDGSRISDRFDITTVSSDISISGSGCGAACIHTTSGNLSLQSVETDALEVYTSSGYLELADVLVTGSLHLETVSSDVVLYGSDAAEIEINTISGAVSATLLSSKNFSTETSSGYVSVPPSDPDSGICRVRTSSGDIDICIQP